MPAYLVSTWLMADFNRDSAGRVTLQRKEIAQLIGKVFIQKAGVNLLSTVSEHRQCGVGRCQHVEPSCGGYVCPTVDHRCTEPVAYQEH